MCRHPVEIGERPRAAAGDHRDPDLRRHRLDAGDGDAAGEKDRVDPGGFIGFGTADRVVDAGDRKGAGATGNHKVPVLAGGQCRLHLADTLLDRDQGRLAAWPVGARQYRVFDRHRADACGLQLLDRAPHVERVAVTVIGIDQKAQIAGAADAIGLASELGQCHDDKIGRAQHRHRADRAGEDADLEAEILGDPRRDRVIDGAGVHAAIAGHQRAEALAPFGPIHGISSPSQVFGIVFRVLSLSWVQEGQRELIMDKRIAVVGAGAIGGYTGGHLAHNGFDVTLIDPWPEHIETIRKDGLALEGMTQEEFVCARPRTMHLTEAQHLAKEKPIDIAMVAVKSYDTEWATRFIVQYLAPDGYVVSLQNCMNEERIAGVVGWDKTVGAIPALLGAELYAPGRVRRTAARGASPYEVYRVGEVHGRVTKRLEELAEVIGTVDTVKATTNLWGERWSKLCVNGMANGVAAATGMSGNEMNRDEKSRRLSIRLAGEGVRVGQALGYQLEHIRAHEPETLARAAEGDRAALDEIETEIVAGLRSNTRSELARPSMGQDMFKGRRTEIDFINGVIAEKGREVGVPTPSHVKLIDAVKRVEHGQVPAKPDNLYAI